MAAHRLRYGNEGFTYLGVLFLVCVMAISLTAAASLWRVEDQRDKELDLLFCGRQLSQAIEDYRLAHRALPQPFPTALADLLGEKVGLAQVRYLRRIYIDPMTGTSDWGLVRNSAGGIVAVYSLSQRKPIRQRPIAPEETSFPKSETYAEWKFYAKDTRARSASIAILPLVVGPVQAGPVAAAAPRTAASAGPPAAASAPAGQASPSPTPGPPASGLYTDEEGAPPPKAIAPPPFEP